MGYHWEVLGLEPTGDVLAIKRAYAGLLKKNRPDEHPDAYQELRQAYEWALSEAEWIRQSPHDDAEPVAWPSEPMHEQASQEVPAESAEEAHDPAGDFSFETDRAAALLERWADRLLQCEPDEAEACWQDLTRELENLPLDEQSDASALFADFVLAHEALPSAVLASMARYFRWGRDYRDAERLGAFRLAQLRERLVQEAPTALRDPRQVEQATEVLKLSWVIEHQGKLLGWLYAALAGPHLRRLMAGMDDRQRRALDISFLRWEAIRGATSYAGFIRLFFVLACVIPVAYLLIEPEQGPVGWLGWPLFFAGTYWFTAWGLGGGLSLAGNEMDAALTRLGWLNTEQSRIWAAIGLPIIVALIAHDAAALSELQAIFPDRFLGGAAIAICIVALLVAPEGQEERQVALPMLGALTFGLTSLTGGEGTGWIVAMGAAAAWIGVGGWAYQRYHEQVIAYYRDPWNLIVIAVFVYVLTLALPVTLRVVARYLSPNTAWLVIGLAVGVPLLAAPDKAAAASLPAMVLAAAALTGLQALAERASGRIFRHVPATFFEHDD